LHGVGIDGFDLLRERLERPAVLRLCFGGLAFVGVLDDVRLLHAVTDAINDLVAALECAVDVGNGGCGIDFCHDILCYDLFWVIGIRSSARLTPCAGDEDCCWRYDLREQSLAGGGQCLSRTVWVRCAFSVNSTIIRLSFGYLSVILRSCLLISRCKDSVLLRNMQEIFEDNTLWVRNFAFCFA